MKRRHFVTAILAAPAAPALLAQQPTVAPPTASSSAARQPAAGEAPKLDTGIADQAGVTVTRFFTAQQLSALRKLGDVILPSINGAPGASEASAAEFLDFLVGQSAEDKQKLYRTGLRLN